MSSAIRTALATTLVVLAWVNYSGSAAAADTRPYGFGASTSGGSAGQVVRVTNTRDDGSAGSLRTVLAGGGGKRVVFDAVSGTINLKSDLRITAPNVTIDGTTARSPGITLSGRGVKVTGRDARDVVIRGLTVRGAAVDGIAIDGGASRVLVDHVSIYGSRDGNLDITQAGTRDVTVQWSVMAEPAPPYRNVLIRYRATRVTMHHNLFRGAKQRNPDVSYETGLTDSQTTLDMRNNVVRGWNGGQGTHVNHGARANIASNWYSADGSDPGDGLIVCLGSSTLVVDCGETAAKQRANVARAWVSGNYSADRIDFNRRGREAAPFAADYVPTSSAQTAERDVRALAGAERR